MKKAIIGKFVIASILLISCNENSQEITHQENEIHFDVIFSEDSTEITLGDQTWMSKNLKTRTFRNGDSIPIAYSISDWEKAGWSNTPICGYYDNNPKNGEKYGMLYNWYAVNDKRGLAPEGWNIPSDSAWTDLKSFLKNDKAIGYYLKSATGWVENGNGNNSSGFNALPSGWYSDLFTEYRGLGEFTCWWSTNSGSTAKLAQDIAAWTWSVEYSDTELSRLDFYKSNGFSVRCIKD